MGSDPKGKRLRITHCSQMKEACKISGIPYRFQNLAVRSYLYVVKQNLLTRKRAILPLLGQLTSKTHPGGGSVKSYLTGKLYKTGPYEAVKFKAVEGLKKELRDIGKKRWTSLQETTSSDSSAT